MEYGRRTAGWRAMKCWPQMAQMKDWIKCKSFSVLDEKPSQFPLLPLRFSAHPIRTSTTSPILHFICAICGFFLCGPSRLGSPVIRGWEPMDVAIRTPWDVPRIPYFPQTKPP